MTLDIERERREFEAAINDMPPISEEDMMEICGSDQTSFAFTMWLAAKRAMLGSAEPVAWLIEWGKDRVRAHGKMVQLDEPHEKYECNRYLPLYTAPPAPVSAEPVKVNIHHVKLKSRKEMEETIPQERLGWWHDACPGENLVMRDATASDLARCSLKAGSDRKPENYLCELPENGSLVHRDAIKHCRTIAIAALSKESP